MNTGNSILQIKTPRPLDGLTTSIGNTPLLPIKRIARAFLPDVRVGAKAEWFNPSGSIKDRPAWQIMQDAIAEGLLTEDKRLLDSTSGNMGIAYATFGANLGVGVTLVIPANASPERIRVLRALGAEIILSDAAAGADGAVTIARDLARRYPRRFFYANQYDNPANWRSHYQTTAPEIIAQTFGQITHFAAGVGTSGTLTGVARYLRTVDRRIEIIAVQPDRRKHGIDGLKHMPTAIRPAIYDPALPDRIVRVTTEEARTMTLRLAREEGYFTGISSGANLAAALKVAAGLKRGLVVTVFPDAGFKYLSGAGLWDGD